MRIAPHSASMRHGNNSGGVRRKATLYYSQSDIISMLTKLSELGLSKSELAEMRDWTLEMIDNRVNTITDEGAK